MKTLQIQISKGQVTQFCRRWKITELAFFGSVLRNDFGPKSDVDVLIVFSPNADWSLFDHIRMQDELSLILGRKVDLVSKHAVEKSHNWIRRKSILGSAKVFYAA